MVGSIVCQWTGGFRRIGKWTALVGIVVLGIALRGGVSISAAERAVPNERTSDASNEPPLTKRVIRDTNLLLTKYRSRPSADEQSSADAVRDLIKLVERGNSSRTTRKQAIEALPLDQMTADNRNRAQAMVDTCSVFRRLPTVQFEVVPGVYRYFAAHPHVAVSIWRALEVSKFEMRQTGQDTFEADAGDGTQGDVQALYRGRNEIVVLCSGQFKSPLLPKPIASQAMIHLQAKQTRGEDGRPLVTHRADIFLAFPSQTVETAAKVFSPVSNMIVDHNFREVSLFVHMMSQVMVHQPGWVEQLARRLEGVPESHKTELMQLSAQVYVAERKRQLRATEGIEEVSLEQVLAPLQASESATSETNLRPAN